MSAGVFDRHGRMLAQAVTGTPGHVNSMANAVKHFLDVYPLATMKPGDHFITNDPWLTSGHLHDITVVTPSFYRGEAGRPVRQYHSRRRYRRARHGPGRAAGVRGGLGHPDHAARTRRGHERGPAAIRARQCARALAGRGRHLCLRRLQRRRQPAARRHDGRIRHRQSRPPRRHHHGCLARGDARRASGPCPKAPTATA